MHFWNLEVSMLDADVVVTRVVQCHGGEISAR